ncbi:hypothetical protein [Guillardia theta]|uniref:Uncharacterized protein n=2 Tax=Guillardia theta TaxID=55529 RepID=Q9AW82_GUITH|nr:hypothetical protein GTHECHR2136 [Guillardia theta]CAC26987.1 hypothetical protein [Guillardia theta]
MYHNCETMANVFADFLRIKLENLIEKKSNLKMNLHFHEEFKKIFNFCINFFLKKICRFAIESSWLNNREKININDLLNNIYLEKFFKDPKLIFENRKNIQSFLNKITLVKKKKKKNFSNDYFKNKNAEL